MRAKLVAIFLPAFLAFAVLAVAQTSRRQGTSSEQGQKAKQLIGCLKSGTTPDTFTLTNVEVAQTRTGKTPSQMARTETSYKLMPESGVNLARHVGHKVEITGNLTNDQSSISGERSQSQSQSQNADIKVSSIRHLSDTCP